MPKAPSVDFSALLPRDDAAAWMRPYRERAKARLFQFKPVTVEDRFKGFEQIRFQPHGLFMPHDDDLRSSIDARLKDMGRWPEEDDRLRAYVDLQQETAQLERDGVPGGWVGQQAIARSLARFRLAAYGRRAGKTKYAAAEAMAIALVRPRSNIWLAAPIAKLSGRAFEYALEFLDRSGIPRDECRIRNQEQVKDIWLPNGSHIEGVSLENVLSVAGAAVDFAVVDEAAQISPEAWYRGVVPPLMDREGSALLISSFEGEGDFFSDKVLEVKAEAEKAKAKGDDYRPEWELFQGASYDLNFYAFPKGIDSDTLVAARKEMPVADFREQFGAMVAGVRNRVFPQFKEFIHVGNYPFNPEKPVRLACDPSSGANPYAVLVLQDYGDYVIAVDELYERHAKVEDYDPIMRRKPWARNAVDMVVDSAWPHDIQRWNALGWKAFAVKKPGIPESLPVVGNLLRNSRLWDDFYQARVHYFMRRAGYEPEKADHIPADDMKTILYMVEESLSDANLSADDIVNLKEAAQFFVNRSCTHLIHEMKAYHYKRQTQANANVNELPQDHDNHLIDAFRYWAWTFKRWAEHDHPKLRSLMTYSGPKESPAGIEELAPLDFGQAQGRLWLETQRARHRAPIRATRSYLRKAS